jgi:polysaccharide transporter, PST family
VKVIFKSNLFKNISYLFVLQLFSYALPLVLIPFLTNTYGIYNYGKIVVAQAMMFYFMTFIDYGIHLYAPNLIAQISQDREKLSELSFSIILLKVIFCVLGFFLLIIILKFPYFSEDYNLYLISYVYVVGFSINPIWFFQGIEKMKYITILGVLVKGTTFLLTIYFVKTSSEITLYPLINGFVTLFFSIIALFIIFRKFIDFRLRNVLGTTKKIIKDCAPFFISRLSVTLYTNSNTFILGITVGPILAGYFNIAERIYTVLLQLYQPFIQSLYPYISRTKKLDNFKFISKWLILLNLLMILFILFFGKNIMHYFFDYELVDNSFSVLQILFISLFITLPSVLIGYPLLGGFGYSKYANRSVVFAALFHLISLCLLWLFNQISPYMVAIVLIFTQIIDLLYRIYGLKKTNLLNLLWK